MQYFHGQKVTVDIPSKKLLSVDNEDLSGVEHNQVLNLSDEGERWEGDVLNNQPYGWGVVYDKEGEMAYEGFRIGDVNVCYGMQYYADIGVMEYKGEICKGKRCGKGIQYDRNGVVVYDGEWMNDGHLEKRFTMSPENQTLHNRIEQLIVSKKTCNEEHWKMFDVSFIHSLKKLTVNDECFNNVQVVRIIGLKYLESIYIEENCFSYCNDNTGRCFYLKDCESLKQLSIGCYSFVAFSVCEIENVDRLESISMGISDDHSKNFHDASLELKSRKNGMK